MSDWENREMCQPYFNPSNDEDNPWAESDGYWEVTFRTAWTDEKGHAESDTFEWRRRMAGENALGYM